MSKPASVAAQPESFAFTPENRATADKIIARYPAERRQSAVIPLLHIAQRQHENWLPRAAMDHVAEILGMAPIKVYEVATFYTMYNHAPVGKHLIEVCTTTPCWLRGSDEIVGACKRRLGISPGETTPDGQFTVVEVECAGACVNAPVVAIGDDYYEDLDGPAIIAIIDQLERGEQPTPGSQIGRRGSCPQNGPTTMTSQSAISAKAADAGGLAD
ncbi:MAG: NADH-quinone oxidoreductase subunit NuoE [Rhodospirillaceae bacterium]